MGGFEKIELTTEKEEKNISPDKKDELVMGKRKKRFQIKKRFIFVPIIVVIVLTILVAIPAYATYKSGIKTYRQAKLFADAMKKQNVALASEELEKTKVDLAETRRNFRWLGFLRFIPLANFYYNDADHMLKAGTHGLETTTIIIDSLKPYADVLGLKGEGSFAMGSAEERIKTAVMTMGKITPRINDISKSLLLAKTEIDKVNPEHYPEFLFGPKVKTQLTQIREFTDQGVEFVDEAQPLIKVLPSLLGESEEKKYLVLFQNDKELRPTGGFITAYSVFRIDKGVIHIDRSDDIYKLDDSIVGKPKAPAPILKYLPKVSTLNLRDSNLSPDYIESMKTFQELYENASAKVDVDGIIALDTHVLVSTIKILDDSVTASGVTFTTKEDPRCKCPQVIYVLEDNISRPVNYVKEDRKGLIGSLMYAIMEKSLSSSPKIYWGPLFQTMLTQVNEKHVIFYLYDKEAQKGIESLNAAGKILPFEGDYLHINDANFGGQKSNLFVKQGVESKYTIEKDGSIIRTVTINYNNPQPPSDCSLERGGLCLNAVLRDWVRVYVPKGSELIENKGSQVKVSTYEDLGKTVFEGFLTVRPLGKATYMLSYRLPFKLKKNSPLPVLIQKQPGTNDNQYKVVVNGKTVEEFPLLTDKELQLEM